MVQSGFARWDASRVVDGFRRVAGDEVAEIARRSYAGESVPDEEWALVAAAFGPRVPDDDQKARMPKNLELNSHGMDLVRHLDIVDQLRRIDVPTLVSVGDSTRSHPSPQPKRSLPPCRKAAPGSDVFEGAGHFTWMDNPERYWATIIGFIDSTTRRDQMGREGHTR